MDAAATNFRLHLAAPAKTVAGDTTPPTIVGQYPSACAYVYGTAFVWNGPFIYGDNKGSPWLDADGNAIPQDAMPASDVPTSGTNPVVFYRGRTQWHPGLEPAVDATQQDCADFLQAKHNGRYVFESQHSVATTSTAFQGKRFIFEPGIDGINDVLPEINPSITFSEPIDPASLHATNGVQLVNTTTNAPVPAALRVQGSIVVVDPTQPLDYNTQYTLSVGTGLTDLAGNALTSGRQIVFHTAPYVPSTDGPLEPPIFGPPTAFPNNIIETAPFLTTLYPGLPCALTGGNFKTGGDTAGYCTGSDQSSTAPMRKWGVFKLPANRAVHMVFSKPVQSSSIVLANGCLTSTDGVAAMASNNGSVAVQIMNSSGQCTGVVAAGVLLPHPDYAYTRALSIRPASPWQPGQRYWLVVCGSNNTDATCVTGKTIVDVDNGQPATQREADNGYPTHDGRLNTDPMNGTGTNVVGAFGNVAAGYGTTALQQAAGGPDIVMPFDGAPASQDQFLIAQLKPFTDVNGNGFAGGAEFGNILSENPTVYLKDKFFQGMLSPDERERPTPMNRVLTRSVAVGYANLAGAGYAQIVYNSGAQPSSVGDVRSAAACNAMMSADVQAMVGTNHGPCAPVTIYPGGMVAQTSAVTSISAGYAPYGRTLLHTAGMPKDPDDPASPTVPQTGYIVDHCQGTYLRDSLPTNYHQYSAAADDTGFVAGIPTSYSYSPCFVVQQHFIFTADPQVVLPGFLNPTAYIRDDLAPQEPLTVDLVGPVSFDRNGRLVIQATNVRSTKLKETLAPLAAAPPNTIAIPAGRITVQLLGPVIHGGPLAAFKTQ